MFPEEEIKQLSKENIMLKETIRLMANEKLSLTQRIKDLEDVCDGSCSSDYEELPYGDEPEEKDALIAELQYQHQQDCIHYNDIRTAYLVTLDELARLREQFGVGR